MCNRKICDTNTTIAYSEPILSALFLLSDDTPKLEPVVHKSSSPGLVRPEVPVDKVEATAPVTEPSSTVEPEPPFPASLTASVVPLTVANANERPSASASSPTPSAGEQKPSLASPKTVNTDKPLSDAPRTQSASPSPTPKALNGLVESGTEPDTAAHEPSLLPAAPLQTQASAPADKEAASSEMLPSDMRPEVPIAAAIAPKAPVAVVPVTLTSCSAPVLPVMLPPGLPPLVQATTEADELSKSIDSKDLVSKVGTEALSGITDSKTESQQQAFATKNPSTGTGSVAYDAPHAAHNPKTNMVTA